ncbi:NB-ARC domains-containing protein [Tanacetum coccineum]
MSSICFGRRLGDFKKAHELLHGICSKRLIPDGVTHATMMDGYWTSNSNNTSSDQGSSIAVKEVSFIDQDIMGKQSIFQLQHSFAHYKIILYTGGHSQQEVASLLYIKIHPRYTEQEAEKQIPAKDFAQPEPRQLQGHTIDKPSNSYWHQHQTRTGTMNHAPNAAKRQQKQMETIVVSTTAHNPVLLQVKCTYLPPLGQLASLTELSIEHLNDIKVVGSNFFGTGLAFSSLEILSFYGMSGWELWSTNSGSGDGDAVLPCLKDLSLTCCLNLVEVSLEALPSLRVLTICGCGNGVLRSVVHVAQTVTKLKIEYIKGHSEDFG